MTRRLRRRTLVTVEVKNEVRFYKLQETLWDWQDRNFGPNGESAAPRHCFLGMCEEAGELIHSILKMSQGIRGTKEEHIADIKDAIGDIMVYLINFYHRAEEIGYIESKEGYFRDLSEQRTNTNIQMELLGWQIYKDVAYFGLYFEPIFTNNTSVPKQYHQSLKDCAEELCTHMSFICNILHTTLFKCIEQVWVNTLSKRDWKADPTNGGVGILALKKS